MEISNAPDMKFRIIVIKMVIELRRMNEYSKNFNKEIENIRKNQTEVTELKNTINEVKKKK